MYVYNGYPDEGVVLTCIFRVARKMEDEGITPNIGIQLIQSVGGQKVAPVHYTPKPNILVPDFSIGYV